MYNNHYYCVIMAGGIGSRFWPISRESKPKQFLTFSASGKSFLRLAYERVLDIIPQQNILIVSLTRYRSRILSDIPDLDENNLLLEPYNRNTAPCIAYATYTILKRDPNAVMVVVPADQVVDDRKLYRQTLLAALTHASSHKGLITIGVVPTRPDTNFGYIQFMGSLPEGLGPSGSVASISTTTEISDRNYTVTEPLKVKTFTEKPDKDLAQVFIDSGEFLWNAGIFIWQVSSIADALATYAPEITSLWRGWEDNLGTTEESAFLEKIYPDMPRTSIDYAVMEKASDVSTFPATFGWADIGNWDSFYEYLAGHDVNGNAVRLRGKSLLKDNEGSIVFSTRRDKLIAVTGMDNFIVIDTDDVLMICPRDEARLKEFLSELAMPEYQEYR